MSDLIKDYRPLNRPPGTLTAVPGEDSTARIHLLEYRGEQINVVEISGLEQLAQQLADGHPASAVTWVHVVGLGDMRTMQGLAEMFKLHPLAMEDVTHLGQRSKVEAYDNQLQFVVLQHLAFTQDEVKVTQVALFVGKDFVVSFQPGGTDLFEPLRSRICETQGRIHERGADYLAYIIIDLVIDTAFPVLEALGEQLDTLEDNVVNRPAPNVINTIYQLQRQLLNLRRVLWPQREVLSRLMRDDLGFISTEMRVYLRDSSDHAVQAMDVVDSYREMAASLLDVHLSNATNRLTDVMRVLMVIATLFTPPTFLASMYGMNFDRSSPWNMPELGWEYGYLMVWGIVIVMTAGMLIYFRRKHWL